MIDLEYEMTFAERIEGPLGPTTGSPARLCWKIAEATLAGPRITDTVKKHVGHVLAKLGAANRTEAVARARELSLIPLLSLLLRPCSDQWQWSGASRRVLASPLSDGEPAITGSRDALGCSCRAGRWPASRRGSS